MKSRTAIISFIATFFIPFIVFAQYDERESGLYAIVGNESKPLSLLDGMLYTVDKSQVTILYDGETAGVVAADTFVLVVGHDKLFYFNDPFIESLTPDELIILPLKVNKRKHRMECQPGRVSEIGNFGLVRVNRGIDFRWNRITDNSFGIKVTGLTPGEYEISVPVQGSNDFRDRESYGFTIKQCEKNKLNRQQ